MTKAEEIIRDGYVRGASWVEVARRLNSAGAKTRAGRPWTNKSVSNRWARMRTNAGIENIGPEDVPASDHAEVVAELTEQRDRYKRLWEAAQRDLDLTRRNMLARRLESERRRAEV